MKNSQIKHDMGQALRLALLFPVRIIDYPMRGLQKLLGMRSMPWVFLLPNLGFFSIFVVIPLFINFIYSFTDSSEILLSDRPFVGGDQYGYLLDCKNYLDANSCREDLFWRAIYNTVLFVTFQVALMIGLSLLTALVLNMKIRARGFFRAVFFFPVLLSPVVVALIWKWLLLRDGLLNAWLVGLGFERILFFVEPAWAMFWAIFVSVWSHMGFYTLILLAGLQAISPSLYEAAEMDGTPRFRALLRITLPLLWPNMLVVLVLALIKSVQTFDEVYVLTGGGPGTATQFIVQYIYDTAFSGQAHNFGLAAAASSLLGAVLMVLTFMQLWVGKLNKEQ